MPAIPPPRVLYRRFIGLGWPRVLLVIGAVLLLLALVSPVWDYTETERAGSWTDTTYGWTTQTAVDYQNGAWTQTTVRSYTQARFNSPNLANAAGAAYLLMLIFLVVLAGVILLFSLEFSKHLPPLALLITGLVVVIFGLIALFDAVLTFPSAASIDQQNPAVTGFWGSAGSASWGAGLGWWLLLVGVLLGIVGGVWPFLRVLRSPMARVPPPPPREWQVER